jgi:hypothetical protein
MVSPLPTIRASKLAGVNRLSLDSVYRGEHSGNMEGKLVQHLLPTSATIEIGRSTPQSATCFVWCLNGPESDDFGFTKRTIRDRMIRYIRRRKEETDRVGELKGHSSSLDYLSIPGLPGGVSQATLAKVPNGIINNQLRPITLEYELSDPDTRPDAKAIDDYIYALSFAIGRRLIPVGISLFDQDIRPFYHKLRSAWSMALGADCSRRSYAPIPLTTGSSLAAENPLLNNEIVLATLIEGYQREDKSCALSEAMWLIWLAEASPLDAALPNFAAALECIMNAWFRSSKTKSSSKYMPDADWQKASADALSKLKESLGKHQYADRMLRRAAGANNFGVNERFGKFFEELELPVGKVEDHAIYARNKAAHGGRYESAHYEMLGNWTRAYRTLLHRVVLKIVDWKGEYIDYSAYGFPSRALAEPLSGPQGDGKPAGA